LAQFERSVTDAVLLTERAATSPAARIAREFFDETFADVGNSAQARLAVAEPKPSSYSQ
jgi:hypothetical protein